KKLEQDIKSELIKLYDSSSKCDIIRIGVVDFEKEYNSSNFVKLKNKFTFKLDELVPTTKIPKNILEMIKNISKVKTFEESEKLLKRIYSSHSLFSSEIRLSLEVAIRASAEKMYFSLDAFYWERNLSESHISHGMFLDLFVNLFYDGMKYLVDDQKELLANKSRRVSLLVGKNSVKALVPDIKITFRKRDLECLVIEHGKFEAVIDNGKALSDTDKLCTLLHDMLRSYHKLLKKGENRGKINQIHRLKAFGILTSKLDMKIYTLSLPLPQLYIFQCIGECSFPKTIPNIDQLKHCLELLIKLRFLVDKNLEELQDILEAPPGGGTSDEEWVIKQNLTPQSISRIKKYSINEESHNQNLLLAFEDSLI
ncbi:9370_t:CDS:2, partial [Entrophospora sp. SA101]